MENVKFCVTASPHIYPLIPLKTSDQLLGIDLLMVVVTMRTTQFNSFKDTAYLLERICTLTFHCCNVFVRLIFIFIEFTMLWMY